MRSTWQRRLAWLAAAWLGAGCGPAEPARRPEPATIQVPPAAPAPEPAVPAGYVPMHVVSMIDGSPMVVLHGEPGSYLAYRPEIGQELKDAIAAALVPVSSSVAQFVEESLANKLSPKTREPYEKWARDLLATGAVLVRAEISLRRDLLGKTSPEWLGKPVLLVRRAGKVEAVDAGENTLPVILLHKVPLFVEIDLLKQIGGFN